MQNKSRNLGVIVSSKDEVEEGSKLNVIDQLELRRMTERRRYMEDIIEARRVCRDLSNGWDDSLSANIDFYNELLSTSSDQ